jgi:uncharacterized protein YvpB
LIALIFFTDNFLTLQKQPESVSAITIPSALNEHKMALSEKQQIMSDSKILNVPLVNQMDRPRLFNGCEVTSLAMLLNYSGYSVTKNELANKIKNVPLTYGNGLKGNPNQGFVGDMEDGPGYAVYNGPVFDLAKKYAGDRAVNITNRPFSEVLKTVSDGQPVWVITTTNFAPVSDFEKWSTPQGMVEVTLSEHSVTVTGYDDNFIYVNDPYGMKNRKVDRNNFEKAWEQMGSQAVFIRGLQN